MRYKSVTCGKNYSDRDNGAPYQVTLLRKLVIERRTSCEMLYHNLLDCDPQTNRLRYKRVTCRKNYYDRDNGALSSNTPHVIERKTSCEMLYHNLLDCDPQTNSLRYKRPAGELFRQG